MTRTEFAPAKINLALHITGRRNDGYHLLDSIVVFVDVGDMVRVHPGISSLTVSGPFADHIPTGSDNLCLRAARSVQAELSIHLEKNLPPASGIGGGTADAAAVLRAVGKLPDRPEELGADLPACLLSQSLRMQGVGEVITPVHGLPRLYLVLVNPGVSVSTPQVFAALTRRDGAGLPDLPAMPDDAALVAWLRTTRNDLEPAAREIAPEIWSVLASLNEAGSVFSRMSGSGATCFGIFSDADAAQKAAERIAGAQPTWWVRHAATITGLSDPELKR